MKTIFVTGGCGFIGSAFIKLLHAKTSYKIVNFDNLTYAAQPAALGTVRYSPRYKHYHYDVSSTSKHFPFLLGAYKPFAVAHFAAESHVNHTAERPDNCFTTNVAGTYRLLEHVRHYLDTDKKLYDNFKFLHVSTDEVFGETDAHALFSESTAYAPRSPYAASKAAADHLVRAWWHTYKVPTINTNCTNNFGPWQLPDKLVPLMLTRALNGGVLPVHGKGENVRDWLSVNDHVRALLLLLEKGTPGEQYCIGGDMQLTNLEMTTLLCQQLDLLCPSNMGRSYAEQIEFVPDRLVNDSHYAVDASKIKSLGWKLSETFESALEGTVLWYLENGGIYAA